MTEPLGIHMIGLPEPILHALTPRPKPAVEVTAPPRAAEAAGAVFTPSHQDAPVRGDEHLLTELRMLAELHRAHQTSGSSRQAA
jgi:hypothetical protein